VINPLRKLGESLATCVGWALGGAFFLLGKSRGEKALHPRGEVVHGLISRHGAASSTGVPWLDQAGTDHVAARFSRSLGLPAPYPDILGLALRIPAGHGQFGDVLLATTGTGLLGRYVLLPVRRPGVRAYTSLFPYRTLAGPLLLAATPIAGNPRQYELAYARQTGPWLSFGTLEATQTTHHDHDLNLSFDPVLNLVPGLESYGWAGSPTPLLAEHAVLRGDDGFPGYSGYATNANRLLSGDQLLTLMVPCPPKSGKRQMMLSQSAVGTSRTSTSRSGGCPSVPGGKLM
jgi:hypothetical protein